VKTATPRAILSALTNWIGGGPESIDTNPLQPANPYGHLCKVMGIGVDFDAVKLPRGDHGQERAEAVVVSE
jgi:hypothetical protein